MLLKGHNIRKDLQKIESILFSKRIYNIFFYRYDFESDILEISYKDALTGIYHDLIKIDLKLNNCTSIYERFIYREMKKAQNY